MADEDKTVLPIVIIPVRVGLLKDCDEPPGDTIDAEKLNLPAESR